MFLLCARRGMTRSTAINGLLVLYGKFPDHSRDKDFTDC